MNVPERRNGSRSHKQTPGCLGKMVNLFETNNGVGVKRMITDKPHHEDYPIVRSQSDMSTVTGPHFGVPVMEKMISSTSRRNIQKIQDNGTPMKTLIAQELSKESESKQNSPNLVAKLMGLDTFPNPQANVRTQRSFSSGYSRNHYHRSGDEGWDQNRKFTGRKLQFEGNCCRSDIEFKDVYEVRQQNDAKHFRVVESPKGLLSAKTSEQRMSLVREKFIEAKRLATDEKGCQSKEFVDAVEVLSSNRDLFLKFLQESNSMFSNHLYDMQSTMSTTETKRITVLRPSSTVDSDKLKTSEKKAEVLSVISSHDDRWERNIPNYSPAFPETKLDDCPSQPTRIVVLKPTPGKSQDIIVPASFQSPPSEIEEFSAHLEGDRALETSVRGNVATWEVEENVMDHQGEETLHSSVFSNGDVGDDSSYAKSETEYADGNFSDAEILSPTSKHSWDFINKFGSPYSNSSFSRASCSPESSVCREAKKRLSERWAMMASSAISVDHKDSRKSSSTLGEMLSLSDSKPCERPVEEPSKDEPDMKTSTSCFSSNVDKENGFCKSPQGLLRSKSLPASSTAFEARTKMQVNGAEYMRQEISHELSKGKNLKTSFKGRVASLFLSKIKRSNKGKSALLQLQCDSLIPFSEPIPLPSSIDKAADNGSFSFCGFEDSLFPGRNGSSSKATKNEEDLSIIDRVAVGQTSENIDQPSPISVLEPLFDDESNIPEPSARITSTDRGAGISLRSNLIGKSPPIGSISRTITWNDSFLETYYSPHSKTSPVSSRSDEDEPDWMFLLETLLSETGLLTELHSESLLSKWYSPESPLDPLMREKYANLDNKELLQEAKRRRMRSYRKLVFDSVNSTLMELANNGFPIVSTSYESSVELKDGAPSPPPLLVNYLWDRMKEGLVNEMKWTCGDPVDSNSLVVDTALRKEVVGKGWTDGIQAEVGNIEKEIEGKLLDELVEETIFDVTISV